MKMSPCVGRDEAGDHVEHGGLAGAVGSEQPDRFPARDGQADALHHHALAVGLLDVLRAEPAFRRERLRTAVGVASGIGLAIVVVEVGISERPDRARRCRLVLEREYSHDLCGPHWLIRWRVAHRLARLAPGAVRRQAPAGRRGLVAALAVLRFLAGLLRRVLDLVGIDEQARPDARPVAGRTGRSRSGRNRGPGPTVDHCCRSIRRCAGIDDEHSARRHVENRLLALGDEALLVQHDVTQERDHVSLGVELGRIADRRLAVLGCDDGALGRLDALQGRAATARRPRLLARRRQARRRKASLARIRRHQLLGPDRVVTLHGAHADAEDRCLPAVVDVEHVGLDVDRLARIRVERQRPLALPRLRGAASSPAAPGFSVSA